MKKQIIISIDPDAVVSARTKNIKGSACLKFKRIIQDITNSSIVDSVLTSEYYETELQNNCDYKCIKRIDERRSHISQ